MKDYIKKGYPNFINFTNKLQLRNICVFVKGNMRDSMDIRVFDRSFMFLTMFFTMFYYSEYNCI